MNRLSALLTRLARRDSRHAMLLGGLSRCARALVLATFVIVGATVVRNVTDALQHAVHAADTPSTVHIRGGQVARL